MRSFDGHRRTHPRGPHPEVWHRALQSDFLMLRPRSRLCAATGWVAVLTLSLGPALVPTRSACQDEQELHLASFDQVWTTIRDKHFDPDLGGLDWDEVRGELRPLVERADSREEVRGILNRMLDRLEQSHLAVLPPGSMGGLGATTGALPPGQQTWDTGCGFEVRIEDARPIVASVVRRSAVARAGVAEGWRVHRIAGGEPLAECRYTGPVTLPLVSAKGDSVTVEFADPEDELVTVEIPLEARRSRKSRFGGGTSMKIWVEHERLESNVGYISFNLFFDPNLVMSQFNNAMESFMDADGVVIDLRGNRGGLGAMAMGMAGWFVEEEGRCLGTTYTRACDVPLTVSPRAQTFEGPVAVLIDGGSGSTAEVCAAGFRDLGIARLFGQTTMGAVLPSAFDELPNGDVLQYVIADYVSANGQRLEGEGVAPDERVDASRRGTSDACLEAATIWIEESQ